MSLDADWYEDLKDKLSPDQTTEPPANAEGIASEGGSASAANPREVPTDAPSAEAAAARFWEDRYRTQHRTLHRVADKLTETKALAGELAEMLGGALPPGSEGDIADFDPAWVERRYELFARHHAAVAQHDEDPHG